MAGQQRVYGLRPLNGSCHTSRLGLAALISVKDLNAPSYS